ncbi:MAG: CHRD domain-containing protein [Balneolales bacterium]|nr:CHRD domain-containing protein [Balneolales bacterium]
MKILYTTLLLLFAVMLSNANAQTYTANLSGNSETHLVTTMASGMISAELDGNMLTVSGSFEGLSSPVATEIAGGAHVHMALAGTDGDVVLVLDATLDADLLGGSFAAADNMFELTTEQIEALQSRMLYVNIHTEMFTAGELRGQLVPSADQVFRVTLTGNNESKPITTTASGALVAELNDHTLTLSGSFSGLSDDLATEIAGGGHIHMGLTGSNGDVVKVLTITADEDLRGGKILAEDNMFDLSHMELVALLAREFYVNIHSEAFPSGELRGQILSDGQAHFQANLSGAFETAPVNTMAYGAVVAEIVGENLIVTGSFSDLSSAVATEIAGGAHVHMGVSGRDGGIAFSLNPTISADGMSGTFARSDNTIALTPEILEALYGRELYVNVHTDMENAGELRGQLLPVARTYLAARLDGLNEVIDMAPVWSDARGLIQAELTGNRLSISGSFDGLGSKLATEIAGGAHIHMGEVGTNGGVVFALVAQVDEDLKGGVFMASENTFELTTQQQEALLAGELYVNIHSVENTAGEIRGQLLADLQFYPSESEITFPANGAEVALGMDLETEITIEWSESMDSAGNGIVYVWQAATDADFENTVVIVSTDMPMFTATTGDLDMILADAGVEIGGSATIYHRAYASNGSLVTPGPTSMATFTRSTSTSIDDVTAEQPLSLRLDQNYPNPFNPSTQIRFEVPQSGDVSLEVFDMTGRLVSTLVNGTVAAGTHTVSFDASSLSSGVYLYRLSAGQTLLVNRMTLIK